MKKFLTSLMMCAMLHAAAAEPADVATVATACEAVAEAYAKGSTVQLRSAANTLRSLAIEHPTLLNQTGGRKLSLDNHYIFDEVFIDSLITNRAVISFAREYARRRENKRGSGHLGQAVYLKNMIVAAGDTLKIRTAVRGAKNFAVVAEPGGLLTLQIRDIKGLPLYSERDRAKTGAQSRRAKVAFESGEAQAVELLIVNCGEHDSSFALIFD